MWRIVLIDKIDSDHISIMPNRAMYEISCDNKAFYNTRK